MISVMLHILYSFRSQTYWHFGSIIKNWNLFLFFSLYIDFNVKIERNSWSNDKIIFLWSINYEFDMWKQPLVLALEYAIYITLFGRDLSLDPANIRCFVHRTNFSFILMPKLYWIHSTSYVMLYIRWVNNRCVLTNHELKTPCILGIYSGSIDTCPPL